MGNRLIEEVRFPPAIVRFLDEERNVLKVVGRETDVLIEVGCMEGRWLDWAIETGVAYRGIDIVAHYVHMGNERVRSTGLDRQRFKLLLGSASRMECLIGNWCDYITPLALFPFNSIGNMEDLEGVLDSLEATRLPFVISTYDTSEYATYCRHEYYKNCQYKGLRCDTNNQGVVFHSADGLRTIAYHRTYLNEAMRQRSIAVSNVVFADIGIAYVGKCSR